MYKERIYKDIRFTNLGKLNLKHFLYLMIKNMKYKTHALFKDKMYAIK